jgi:hypothetical protein
VSYLTIVRQKLGDALAGDTLTLAPTLDTIGALPAVVVRPAVAWLTLDATGGGPASVGELRVAAVVVVTGTEPATAWDRLEAALEDVFDRVPAEWRIADLAGPQPLAWGQVAAWFAELTLATSVSLR